MSSKRIHVLHVITGLDLGGAETMLARLLEARDRDRFDGSVLSLMRRGPLAGRIEAAGVPVESLGIRPPFPGPAGLRQLARAIRGSSADLVQGWMYHGNLAATAGVWLSGRARPVLWNVRGSLDDVSSEKLTTRLVIRLGAAFSRRVDVVLYCARAARDQHVATGYAGRRQEVVPNGFDTQLFRPDPETRREVRRELEVPEDAVAIGLVARYHPVKDHAGFVEAAGRLARRHERAIFVLAGSGVDGRNRELTDAVRASGAPGRFRLLGERGDVPRLLQALDIASSSSFTEAFPNAVGEAMASGLPTVVTDAGDSAWIVGDTGLVVPPRDPEAIARAWSELIDAGPGRRSELGRAARERVLREFSIDAVAHRYEKIYEEVLASARSEP